MTCSRCGRCCYLIDEKTQDYKRPLEKCMWLIRLKDGTHLCRIYLKRNELLKRGWPVRINKGNFCVNRADSKFDYEGCPYNTDKKVLR